jgi:hypothetical protein
MDDSEPSTSGERASPTYDEDYADKMRQRPTAPVYLRDCIDMLYNTEDVWIFEAGFHTIEKLIRQKVPGTYDLCVDVAQQLLRVEQRFDTPDFEKVVLLRTII